MGRLFLIIGSVFLCWTQTTLGAEVVETLFGKVEGSTGESRDGRLFHQFLGIPYAKAERFMPPTDPDSWSDIKNATIHGSLCPQIVANLQNSSDVVFAGSENCLNLNIYTLKVPKADEAKILLPVIVWFFGGGADYSGANEYGPEYWMDTDVILVTFNARLGFLGYLNLGTELAPGNQRLKDQVAMLKWVKENIEKFGGDPDRVTLNGFDSGAAEVGYLMISPMSKGLFTGAITQDGVVLKPDAFIRNPMYQAKKFGIEVGCPVDSKDKLYECLMGKTAKDLVSPFHRWSSDITDADFVKFGPSTEQKQIGERFITENPFISIREGRIANKVPWINILSRNAGSAPFVLRFLLDKTQQQKFNSNVYSMLPRYLDYDFSTNDSSAVTGKIMENYFGGDALNETTAPQFVTMITDRYYFVPDITKARLYYTYAPSYSIINKYIPSCTLSRIMGYNKAFEGGTMDIVSYQFPFGYGYCGIDKASADYQHSKNFLKLLASFAENRKPTKTWGGVKEFRVFNGSDETPFHYGIERDGSTKQHVISDAFKSRSILWSNLHKAELVSEYDNPAEEIF